MTPFQSFALFFLARYFLQAESQTGQILPPQNLSLLWVSDFDLTLSWAPPKHSMAHCTYQSLSKTKEENIEYYYTTKSSVWTFFMVMEGGFLHLSVKTVCNGQSSEPTVLNVTYPEMVKNVQCSIYSSKNARCSWDLATPMPVVRFYYRLIEEDGTISVDDITPSPPLQECPSYNDTNGLRTGCDFQANMTQSVHILFNWTENKMLFRNTFRKVLRNNVRPPPLEWTVKKTGDKFNISWTPPELKKYFLHYLINYTECNKPLHLQINEPEKTDAQLNVVPYCQYHMTIESVHEGFKTPPSDKKYFDAESDPNVVMYAAAVIPLIFAVLAVLTLGFCWRNKECIFPKVPQPRDFLSDFSHNNNKSTLHIPAEEVGNCKIMLMTDSQINKPVC